MKIEAPPPQISEARIEAEKRFSDAEKAEMKRVAQGFEALFVNHLIKEMRQTVSRGGLIPESQAEKVFRGMLDNEYAQKISQSDQLGLSNLVYEHLLRNSLSR